MTEGLPIGQLINMFSMDWVYGGLKLLYLLAFFLYTAFALVVVVQIKQMVATIQSGFEKYLILVGWIHLLIAMGSLLLAFMVL